MGTGGLKRRHRTRLMVHRFFEAGLFQNFSFWNSPASIWWKSGRVLEQAQLT
jgi:hypothetical protein